MAVVAAGWGFALRQVQRRGTLIQCWRRGRMGTKRRFCLRADRRAWFAGQRIIAHGWLRLCLRCGVKQQQRGRRAEGAFGLQRQNYAAARSELIWLMTLCRSFELLHGVPPEHFGVTVNWSLVVSPPG